MAEGAGAHTVVLSPHLDDAVLSVGRFLAASPGTVVITVFAGVPDGLGLTRYDRSCGFATSREAVLSRHREDQRALDILGADAVHLDFLDGQYHSKCDDDEIADVLRSTVLSLGSTTVIGPIGSTHEDHRTLGRIWPLVLRSIADVVAYAYADLPYTIGPSPRAAAEIEAFTRANHASPVNLPSGDIWLQAQALLAYASQLRYVCALECLKTPERFWLLDNAKDSAGYESSPRVRLIAKSHDSSAVAGSGL
jgi:LmbE family N-acetylglucosaminyl deacetylase